MEKLNDWKKLSFANSLAAFHREQFSICLSYLKSIFLNENETSLEVDVKEKASQFSWDEIKKIYQNNF